MNNLLPKELELEKLEQIANGWVEEYGGYIAGISFFCSKETSGSNVKEYQYCIDFVLCDPPRIEPVSRFSSGFIAKEAGVMSVRLLGLMPEQTDSELRDEMRSNRFDTAITPQQKKEMEFLSQWRIDIRWETDQPDPSYIPESKQILYSRPKNQPSKQIEFSPEDYERLKRLPSFNLEECIGLMLRMPYEQTIVAIQKGELDIEIASQVLKKNSEYTELLSRSFYDGELKSKDNSLDSTLADPTFKPQVFFEWAKKKGFEIPIGNPIKTDDMKVEVLNHALSVSKNNSASTGPEKAEIDPEEKISRVLTKGWEPEHPIERLSKRRELAIWNKWIQPIMNLHYNGVFGYKYFKEPENLNYDDLGALWEQYLAPVIYSNIPPWVKYPQSMDQRELESRISENIWEPDLFVSQVLWKIRAGMWPEVVEPFFNCLINIVAGKDLPTFLAYIAQGKLEGLELESQQTPVENPSNKPLHEKKPTGQLTGALSSPDDIISDITIRYENDDSQITIQQKGKSKIPVPFKQLRFNKIGITWTNFLKVLQDPPKHYWSYPQNQLKTWNERLINLISKSFAIQFPSNYKLYERAKEAGPGYYRFKFRIEYSDTIQVDESSKETFRNKFFYRIEQYKRNPYDYKLKEIHEMAATGHIKKFFTEDEVREYLDKKSKFNPELEFKKDPETTPEIESEEDEIDFRKN